mmetsp:Transcript_20892/g.25867  ORF Transcript_20892/g.25867 Transcript_20892/m.25867 type:complete len:116 (+) Transcript_20892:119-466(+)
MVTRQIKTATAIPPEHDIVPHSRTANGNRHGREEESKQWRQMHHFLQFLYYPPKLDLLPVSLTLRNQLSLAIRCHGGIPRIIPAELEILLDDDGKKRKEQRCQFTLLFALRGGQD